MSASYPITVSLVSVAICLGLTSGFYSFQVLTNPVELWSPENSETRLNKNYFDSHFRPFYRTTQILIRPTNTTPIIHSTFTINGIEYSSVFALDFLIEVLDLQTKITNLKAEYDAKNGTKMNVTLKDICFAPLSPDNNNCTVMSVLNYYQNDEATLLKNISDPDFKDVVYYDYIDHLQACTQASTTVNDSMGLSCLGDFGGPVFPFVALGGYPTTKSSRGYQVVQYGNATALIITIIINNNNNEDDNKPAEAWEKEMVSFMKSYSNPNMTISFSTERSIQDELNRESQSDISTILISYLAMFLYITLTLGKYRVFNKSSSFQYRSTVSDVLSLFIDMKLTLGLSGVAIVMLSVLSSIGFLSLMGIKATLIIFEVIPFLVLAVGVDNIFILVQNYQRDVRKRDETLEQQIARIVGKVGPSMLLTSTSESLAFGLGALTPMPAVRLFSLYAAMAVFIDFLLQITCFVALMTLDCKRERGQRLDLLCCIRTSIPNEEELQEEEENLTESNEHQSAKNSGFLFRLFKNYYAEFLDLDIVRPLVIIVFALIFFTGVSLAPKVSVGLDQKLSMPKDSYVLDYFKSKTLISFDM